MSSHHVRQDCRLCGSTNLTRVLELPATPLANEFPNAPNAEQEKFPLWLAACADCAHVQLPVVVDPARLFREYVYVSGTSPVFVDHFRRYAADLLMMGRVSNDDLVVEIGSNDGTLLGFFKSSGARVLGVDPAEAIAARATENGIETWPVFFDADVAAHIVAERGQARIVVANNVFAHADDLAGFARAVKSLLRPDGAFVFEVSYLLDVINDTLFDTIYHEHLSYHSVGPLCRFFASLGMTVVDAQRVDTHGGSIRVTVLPIPSDATSDEPLVHVDSRVAQLHALEHARGLACGQTAEMALTFARFQHEIAKRCGDLHHVLAVAKAAGKRIAGYGAPAKATTLLHAFALQDDALDFIVDDSPHKQGRYLPGTSIPVLPISAIGDRKPDVVVILAWNFADSILKKLGPFMLGGGECVVAIEKLTVH